MLHSLDVKKEQFFAMLRASETDPVKSSDVGPVVPAFLTPAGLNPDDLSAIYRHTISEFKR